MHSLNTVYFQSLPSTNTYAKENAAFLPVPSLIIANKQTNGRGRQGNSFFSPGGTGLYMTLLFELPKNKSLITCAAGVAVCSVLEEYGLKPEIKWVNDILIDRRKVCGILTELFAYNDKSYIALGIGINLTTKNFPDNLPNAASIDIDCDKTELAIQISERFFEITQNSDDKKIKSEYENRLFIFGKTIFYVKNGEKRKATVKGINELCHLITENDKGETDILSSGEISVKLNEVEI